MEYYSPARFGLKKACEIYDEVSEAVSRWDCFADEAGVTRKSRGMIEQKLKAN